MFSSLFQNIRYFFTMSDIFKFQKQHDNFNDINDRLVPQMVVIDEPPTTKEILLKANSNIEKEIETGFISRKTSEDDMIKKYIDKENKKEALYQARPLLNPKPLPRRAKTALPRGKKMKPSSRHNFLSSFREQTEGENVPEEYATWRTLHQTRMVLDELRKLPYDGKDVYQQVQKTFYRYVDSVVDDMKKRGMFGRPGSRLSKNPVTPDNVRYFSTELQKIRKNVIYSNIRTYKINLEKLNRSLRAEFGITDLNYYHDMKKKELKEEDRLFQAHVSNVLKKFPPNYQGDFSPKRKANADAMFSKANKVMLEEIELNLTKQAQTTPVSPRQGNHGTKLGESPSFLENSILNPKRSRIIFSRPTTSNSHINSKNSQTALSLNSKTDEILKNSQIINQTSNDLTDNKPTVNRAQTSMAKRRTRSPKKINDGPPSIFDNIKADPLPKDQLISNYWSLFDPLPRSNEKNNYAEQIASVTKDFNLDFPESKVDSQNLVPFELPEFRQESKESFEETLPHYFVSNSLFPKDVEKEKEKEKPKEEKKLTEEELIAERDLISKRTKEDIEKVLASPILQNIMEDNNDEDEDLHKRLSKVWDELGFTASQKLEMVIRYTSSGLNNATIGDSITLWEDILQSVRTYNTRYEEIKNVVKFTSRRGNDDDKILNDYLIDLGRTEEIIKTLNFRLKIMTGDSVLIGGEPITDVFPKRRQKLKTLYYH